MCELDICKFNMSNLIFRAENINSQNIMENSIKDIKFRVSYAHFFSFNYIFSNIGIEL